MMNSTLIDNKIEEAYGIVRENAEKKKRQKRKKDLCSGEPWLQRW